MECEAVVAAGMGEDAEALAIMLALHCFLIHLLISGPLRSYKSLLPPQPAEWIVVIVFRVSSTSSFENSSLNASRMMRLLMPRKRWRGVGTMRSGLIVRSG